MTKSNFQRWLGRGAFAIALAGLATVAWAQTGGGSPVGKWKTIDDATGKPKSIVRIWEKDGEMMGVIDELIREPGEELNPACTECEGERKGQPIKGMNILWGLRQDGTEWSGGKILDPANGKTYKCYIEVVDGGRRLKVRGFVGFALLGRTQYWQRAE